MKEEQNKVAEMMRVYQQETPDKLTMPSLEVRKLRARLILEECLETIDALGFRVFFDPDKNRDDTMLGMDCVNLGEWSYADLTKIRDGIADVLVVTLGTAVACGIDADPDLNEVMRSNMSKLWTDGEVISRFWKHPSISGREVGSQFESTGFAVRKVSNDRRCWLVKDASGKVQKSPSYSKANLL